jgi:hypothetical protein
MTHMMTTSVKLPPIIGPIMIPIFVDLGLDIGDSNNRFPGVYLQVSQTHNCQIYWIKTILFLDNENNGYKFISFKRNYFHKHEKCLCKHGAKFLDLWFLLTRKSKCHCSEWNMGE